MIPFHIMREADLQGYLSPRAGESKLGEFIQLVSSMEELSQSEAKFVLLGAKEDIGVRANMGMGGAGTGWDSFLTAFLNIQHNTFIQGDKLLLLGYFEAPGIQTIDDQDEWLRQLDHELTTVISVIIQAGKVPVLIGGGHNNSLGMISGAALGSGHPVNCINLDPHADLRKTDSRHSGNGFSFARERGVLNQYAILGLHEAYNNQYMLDLIQTGGNLMAVFFEDIFVRNKISWEEALEQSLVFVTGAAFGTELDLDAVEHTLSSALSPVGFSAVQAMRYLYTCGRKGSVYLHLAEGIALREDGMQQKTIGKLLSYLVQSFIKGKLENNS